MNVYIDESGSFVNASTIGKWNAVAALAVPEAGRKKLDVLVRQLKLQSAGPAAKEVKLNEVREDHYFRFLAAVAKLNAIVFCTATDAGRNTHERVAEHQQFQVNGVLKHLDKMRYEGGRRGVELMASQLRNLSPQLYVQLVCQINLMYDVVSRSILYFAQQNPSTLREFRWRVDQKNSARPDFEEAFEKLSPALLQSRSIEEPIMMVRGFNYSFMAQYEYPDGKPPEYLREDYGIEVENAFDIQKLVRGNMTFMDSKDSPGIQAVDLIVSGIRRCLRGGFSRNELASIYLGKLMLQAVHNGPSLNLVTFGAEAPLPMETDRVVKLMSANSRQMIK
ncbi:hypothetical protein SKTS_08720 [Sulfurimicrobium lacus]|uniref:DUF3800 domain-containing protein n=1 Tax=Sulfurimicrobium lacus TaxID=2715678 RepID=A0A6F8VAF7_9PROT|nr:DUF3800 domain-containing protein [Sulfurimicrobium lacus]BCB25986.1 hypothetical protein SKTS_08720 [Sulfurimicrobium lacus]